MIQDTSLQAYYNEVKPTLGERQRVVYEALKTKEDITNTELSLLLDWPINTVVPRVNELRKIGLVEDAGKRICRVTGRSVHSWRLRTATKPVFVAPQVSKHQIKVGMRQLQVALGF